MRLWNAVEDALPEDCDTFLLIAELDFLFVGAFR
jgi:hypothetical protein